MSAGMSDSVFSTGLLVTKVNEGEIRQQNGEG